MDTVPRTPRGRKRAVPRLQRVVAHLERVLDARAARIKELLDASVSDGERLKSLKKKLAELEAQQ